MKNLKLIFGALIFTFTPNQASAQIAAYFNGSPVGLPNHNVVKLDCMTTGTILGVCADGACEEYAKTTPGRFSLVSTAVDSQYPEGDSIATSFNLEYVATSNIQLSNPSSHIIVDGDTIFTGEPRLGMLGAPVMGVSQGSECELVEFYLSPFAPGGVVPWVLDTLDNGQVMCVLFPDNLSLMQANGLTVQKVFEILSIESGDCIGLPAELVMFTGNPTDECDEVKIVWETANEVNVSHFQLLQSYDGINYEVIAEIASNGGPGTSARYSYQDQQNQRTAYYRLVTIDYDDSKVWSDAVSVTLHCEYAVDDSAVYPNLVSSTTRVDLSNSFGEKATIKITNLLGHTVFEKETYQGDVINLTGLETGYYIYYFKEGGAYSKVRTLFKG